MAGTSPPAGVTLAGAVVVCALSGADLLAILRRQPSTDLPDLLNVPPPLHKMLVNARAAARLLAGHPWVYRGDLVAQPGALAPGSAVVVVDGVGTVLGTGLYSSQSLLVVRLLSAVEEPLDAAFFRKRLMDARSLRVRAFGSLPPAWRWVHAEGDLLGGLVVDVMGDALSIQFNTEGMDARTTMLVDILCELSHARTVVLRKDVAVRSKEGLALGKEVVRGTAAPVRFAEGNVFLTVDLLEGQKTGTFLDQRDNHVLAGQLAAGQGLDCFSGDGGFALQLATRCSHVTALDQSAAAVERIQRNAADNGLSNVTARAANVFEALRAMDAAGETFDTVVVDPPALAKGKKHVEASLRGYKELNLRAMKILKPGGLLVTCSCSQPVDRALFDTMLQDAAVDARRSLQVLHRRGAGLDHPVKLGFPEGEYLKAVFATVW